MSLESKIEYAYERTFIPQRTERTTNEATNNH